MHQKKSIEHNFKCFKCDILGHGQELRCKGKLHPNDDTGEYEILIRQKPELPPDVFILNPKIEYNPDIHMYADGSLCLYYPSDMAWQGYTSISEHTIPWINDWIMYYELYKITGDWEGPAAPHGRNKTKT